MLIDDTLRQHGGETEPVRARIHKEAVIGVLGKGSRDTTELLLHIETAAPEHVGQDVGEKFCCREPLGFGSTASCQQVDYSVNGNKLGDGMRNTLFICANRWYNRHSVNLLG